MKAVHRISYAERVKGATKDSGRAETVLIKVGEDVRKHVKDEADLKKLVERGLVVKELDEVVAAKARADDKEATEREKESATNHRNKREANRRSNQPKNRESPGKEP